MTPTQKAALTRAHKSGSAKLSNNGRHLQMLDRLVLAGLLTAEHKITDAGRKALGIKPAPKADKWTRRPSVQLDGIAPLSRATVPMFALSYAAH
jgi:hypothetical protein